MAGRADIVVIGGGPAGVAAAIGSARAGARVVLFERAHAGGFKPGEIIEPTVKYPLGELGLLAGFERLGFLRIAGNVAVWGSQDAVEADAMLNPHGSGYLVDRGRMETWLIDEAVKAGVTVIRGVGRFDVTGGRYRSIAWSDRGRCQELRAGLVVEATGRGAGVVAGPRQRFDSLVAMLVYVPDQAERMQDQRLYIEAAQDGWWYSARLPEKRCVFAFMTDADLLPSDPQARDQLFEHRLAQASITRQRGAGMMSACRTRIYPATSTRRKVISDESWVAVGDAASSYDPLSGYGVTAAMVRGTALARLLARSTDFTHAAARYREAENAHYEEYLEVRRDIYSREQRWFESPFWKRRIR